MAHKVMLNPSPKTCVGQVLERSEVMTMTDATVLRGNVNGMWRERRVADVVVIVVFVVVVISTVLLC